jgi:hypothetical protein
LKDTRKEIDAFIKLNVEFKPFRALEISQYGGSDIYEKFVSAIRTDGKLIVEGSPKDYRSSFYGKKDIARLKLYDIDIIAEKNRIEKEKEDANIGWKNKMTDLCGKLRDIDLSKYDNILNPE